VVVRVTALESVHVVRVYDKAGFGWSEFREWGYWSVVVRVARVHRRYGTNPNSGYK